MQWIIILEYWDMVALIMVANLKLSDASAVYPENIEIPAFPFKRLVRKINLIF
jgi:hypothetical protein